jgi:signal transduction histidine kinase
MFSTNYVLIILIINIIFNFFFGLIVLISGQGWKKLVNRRFFVFTVSAIIWQLANFIMFINMHSVYDLFWTRVTYLTGIFVAYFMFRFIIVFPRVYIQNSLFIKIISILGLVLTLIAAYLAITPSTITHVNYLDGSRSPQYGSTFIFFAVILIILTLSIFFFVINNYLKSTNLAKNQMRYMLIGIIITLLLVVFLDIISPSFAGNNYWSNFDAFSLIFVFGFTFYAIFAHHLFDIRIIIKKTLVYSGLLAFILVAYALIVMSISVVFSGQVVIFGPNGVFTTKMIAPNIIAAIFIAIGFDPIKNWLSHITDKWLFKGDYNQQEVLSKLSENLSTVIDLNEALESMMKTITEAMRVKTAATFVLTTRINTQETRTDTNKKNTHEQGTNNETQIDTNKKELEVKTAKLVGYELPDKEIIEKVHPIIDYFENHSNNQKDAIITDDIKQSKGTLTNNNNPHEQDTNNAELLACIDDLHIAFAMPICTKDKMIGLFILGEKLSGDIFNEKDLDLLDIAVKQTAAAIEKARFYEEDQLKSEFVSIASHELLTPTSAIEGYLSMILDEHLSKVDKKSEEYLRKVQKSAQRLALLVKDLLNVSRIEGGRIVIQWQAFDINDLINTVIEELQPKAKEKKLKLTFSNLKSKFPMSNEIQNSNDKKLSHSEQSEESHKKRSFVPPASETQDDTQLSNNLTMKQFNNVLMVFADEERTHQVLVNLIGNAIKYTEQGSVNIKCQISNDKNNVEVAVADTGMGMSAEDQKHLFEKFYRASNANKFGAGGTGLGLYISKNITELMGGKIWLTSVEDKGSTFYFSLKLATPDQIKNQSTKPKGEAYVAYKK